MSIAEEDFTKEAPRRRERQLEEQEEVEVRMVNEEWEIGVMRPSGLSCLGIFSLCLCVSVVTPACDENVPVKGHTCRT